MSTLNEIVYEAALRCGAAFSGTCSSLGTTTTLIDAATRDQGTDSNFAAGGWIYRPNAADATDKVRRINDAGFATDTGTWTVTRAWTNAPADDEAYQVYAIVPPIEQPGLAESWRRLVNRGLAAIWYEDRIIIGSGDGSLNNRFTLSDDTGFVPNPQYVTGVYFRREVNGVIYDRDQSKNGRGWSIDRANGIYELVTLRAPTSEESVVLSVVRTYAPLTDDDDETTCPLELAALRARYELYRYLNATPQSQGQYEGEERRAQGDFLAEYHQLRPRGALVFS